MMTAVGIRIDRKMWDDSVPAAICADDCLDTAMLLIK